MLFSSTQRRLPRRFGALVLSGALVAGFAGLSLAGSASATSSSTAASKNYDGNKTCADLAPDGVTWNEFKIEGVPANGVYTIPGTDLKITISNASSQQFDWGSDFDMAAVLVKASDGGVHYQYPGTNDKADTGLHGLAKDDALGSKYHDISHVSFCYEVGGDDTTTTTAVTDTTTPTTTETTTPTTTETTSPPTTSPTTATETAVAPQVVVPPAAAPTEVMGETLVQGDTLPRTGATAMPLALAGSLGLGFGLMMLMLGRRKTATQS
ncbi:MAG TPA: hypothetical protein VFS16_07930 [Acidimicrobiia bacterium]|nr:hypothetical protein [Acidimicrobiia bacterium]